MRFAKVKTTDYRPNAGGKPSTGLDQWAATEKAMQREHDRAVAAYPIDTAKNALNDLARRSGHNKDPEFRWIRHRRAALQRKLYAPELIAR